MIPYVLFMLLTAVLVLLDLSTVFDTVYHSIIFCVSIDIYSNYIVPLNLWHTPRFHSWSSSVFIMHGTTWVYI